MKPIPDSLGGQFDRLPPHDIGAEMCFIGALLLDPQGREELLNSVVSVYYYLRPVVAMYMREGPSAASTTSLPWTLRAALAVSRVFGR